jgi:hypothetical protein
MKIDNRSKVNKVIRLLCQERDDYYSEYTLDEILKLIDNNVINPIYEEHDE